MAEPDSEIEGLLGSRGIEWSDIASSDPAEAMSQLKFGVYHSYLQSIAQVILDEYEDQAKFASVCIERTTALQAMGSFDAEWIARRLMIAWNTEFLLSLNPEDADLLRIGNQWKVIQSYYAVYACGEAAAYAIDGTRNEGHQECLRNLTEYFVGNVLSPWDKAFGGAVGKTGKEAKAVNFPKDTSIVQVLQRGDAKPIDMFATCLKAEHSKRVDDLFEKKKGAFKNRFDPGNTGLFHFLYRLRTKAIHQEAEVFLAKTDTGKVREFATDLVTIVEYSLLYMEILLMRRCGKDFMLKLGRQYLSTNKRADGLSKRLSLYDVAI